MIRDLSLERRLKEPKKKPEGLPILRERLINLLLVSFWSACRHDGVLIIGELVVGKVFAYGILLS